VVGATLCSRKTRLAISMPITLRFGDSFDSALAESIIELYKTEVIRGRGPWRDLEAVKFGNLEWVHWFNHRRLFEPIGNIPPAEREAAYYRIATESAMAV